jgi:hypothetical protein
MRAAAPEEGPVIATQPAAQRPQPSTLSRPPPPFPTARSAGALPIGYIESIARANPALMPCDNSAPPPYDSMYFGSVPPPGVPAPREVARLVKISRRALHVFDLQHFTLSEKMTRWAHACDFTAPPEEPIIPPEAPEVILFAPALLEEKPRAFVRSMRRTVV